MGVFSIYAIRTPLHHKLYKELFKSIIISGALTYPYVHYYRKQYYETVDQIYDLLKDKFANNPALAAMRED